MSDEEEDGSGHEGLAYDTPEEKVIERLVKKLTVMTAELATVKKERDKLKETNEKLADALESSGGFDVGFEYGADASGMKELKEENERLRVALTKLSEISIWDISASLVREISLAALHGSPTTTNNTEV